MNRWQCNTWIKTQVAKDSGNNDYTLVDEGGREIGCTKSSRFTNARGAGCNTREKHGHELDRGCYRCMSRYRGDYVQLQLGFRD